MGLAHKWISERCVVKSGKSRIVIDFVRGGFVIKFPIIHLTHFLKSLWVFLWGAPTVVRFGRWLSYPMDNNGIWGMRRLLFKGIADNWREFWFFLRTRHSFVQPTYFSLFGLVNIQKRGIPLEMGYWKFRVQLESLLGTGMFYSDAHHLSVIDNFCYSGDRVRIVDYGSPKTREIILKKGMCVYDGFTLR